MLYEHEKARPTQAPSLPLALSRRRAMFWEWDDLKSMLFVCIFVAWENYESLISHTDELITHCFRFFLIMGYYRLEHGISLHVLPDPWYINNIRQP